MCVCKKNVWNLKVQYEIIADNIMNLFYYFSEKIRLGISGELSQLIHMNVKAYFLWKRKKIFKNVMCCNCDEHFKG